MAFHVLNAWEETVDVEVQDGAAPTTNTVVKVVTCDMFKFSMDLEDYMADVSPGELASAVSNGGRPLTLLLGSSWCRSQGPLFPRSL